MAHSKGPNKGKKSTSDSDELRKPAKLKPMKGKAPKRAKDVSAFEEDEAEGGTEEVDNLEMLSDDDILFNESAEDDFDDDDDF